MMLCLDCPAGYYGADCIEMCPPSYYGIGCLQKCDCSPCHYVHGCMSTPSITGEILSTLRKLKTDD